MKKKIKKTIPEKKTKRDGSAPLSRHVRTRFALFFLNCINWKWIINDSVNRFQAMV